MEQQQRYKLGKQARLKSRKAIDQLFKDGKSFTVFPFRVIYQFTKLPVSPDAFQLQAGFSVSKRHFKKAVDRNRIKRLMREAYRLQKNELETNIQKLPANGSAKWLVSPPTTAQPQSVSPPTENGNDNLKSTPANLVFFMIYTGKNLPDYQLVFEKVKGILSKLQKISNETIDANT